MTLMMVVIRTSRAGAPRKHHRWCTARSHKQPVFAHGSLGCPSHFAQENLNKHKNRARNPLADKGLQRSWWNSHGGYKLFTKPSDIEGTKRKTLMQTPFTDLSFRPFVY
jgi:hypothetical protein